MPIDGVFVDTWSARYEEVSSRPLRLEDTRFNQELHQRFPRTRARIATLESLWDFEKYIFSSITQNVTANGFYAPDELLVVGYWKSPRPIRFLVQNRTSRIKELTHESFTTDQQPWKPLVQLRGVGIPVASALLTVWQPDNFTVVDFRALHTLRAHGESFGSMTVGDRPQSWWEQHYDLYVRGCRELAKRTRRSLRAVDRALWCWSRCNPDA